LIAVVDDGHNLPVYGYNQRETPMQNPEKLTDKLKQLPDADQQEIGDFVDLLLSRTRDVPDYARVLQETAGMWKGEADGIAYEDALREQWRQRR
jgi:hypothetical protein